MAMSPLYHSTCLLHVIYNNINTDIDTTTLTGKGILLTFQRSNFTAHVEIPVGPFALIRAVSQFKYSEIPIGFWRYVEAAEEYYLSLAVNRKFFQSKRLKNIYFRIHYVNLIYL